MILNGRDVKTSKEISNSPTKGFHLIRTTVKNESFDLNACLKKYDFQINTESFLELRYLIIYGRIAKNKIKIDTNAYKDGQVRKKEIFEFLLDIFILEHFNTEVENKLVERITKNQFVNYLNQNFEIITKEGSIRKIYFNDLDRFIGNHFNNGV